MGSPKGALSAADISHAAKVSMFAVAGGGVVDIATNVLNIAGAVNPKLAPYVPYVSSIIGAIVGIFAHRWATDTTK